MGHLLRAVVLTVLVIAVAAGDSRLKKLLKRLIEVENELELSRRGSCPYSKLSTSHSACLNPPRRKSEGVSAAEMQLIVKKHNDLRAGVKPPATNMQTMSWDKEIAMIAQKWASNCVFEHDKNDDRQTLAKTPVGQNMAYSSYPAKNWNQSIQDWYDEVNHFEFGVGSTNGKAVGHYTQLVWATSNKVGCGYAYCPEASGEGYFHHYVCNYMPAGNVQHWNDANSVNKPYLRAGDKKPSDGTGDNGGNKADDDWLANLDGNNKTEELFDVDPEWASKNIDWSKAEPVEIAEPKLAAKPGCMIDGKFVPSGETSSRKMKNGLVKHCTCVVKKNGCWSFSCSFDKQ